MKIKIILIMILFPLFYSCEENYSEISNEGLTIEFHGENEIGKILQKKIKGSDLFQNIGVRLNQYHALLDYATIGYSVDFGPFYSVPLKNIENIIDQYLIFPSTGQDWNGKLCDPILIDYKYLNKEAPYSRRYLYLYRFVEWKQKGLKVKKEIIELASKLNGKLVPINDNLKTKANEESEAPGYGYIIEFSYEFESDTEFTDDGLLINCPSLQAQMTIFRNYMFAFRGSGNCEYSLPEYISHQVIRMKIYYKGGQATCSLNTIIDQYARYVESELYTQFKTTGFRYGTYVQKSFDTYEDFWGKSEGGSGSGEIGGGGSNPPSPESCPECDKNPCECIRDISLIVSGNTTGREAYVRLGMTDLYVVPLYRVSLVGTDSMGNNVIVDYDAIRFGIKTDGGDGAIVVGKSEERTYTVFEYIPNRNGSGEAYHSWRFDGSFLIHCGPSNLKIGVGALGCIEICLGGMARLNRELLLYSNAKNGADLAASGKFKVHILAAPKPPLIPVPF